MTNIQNGQGRTALVTGANKGIGYEVVRGLAATGMKVFLGARDLERGAAAVEKLKAEGFDVQHVVLDLADHATMVAAAETIASQTDHLDILVNNAGIIDPHDGAAEFVDIDATRRTFETNFFATVLVTQAMLPLIKKSGSGRIVNVSSGLGSLTLNAPGAPYAQRFFLGYKASKAALNMFTVQLAEELKDAKILVNSADPGYTATDLNGHQGTQTVSEGAEEAIRLSLLPDDGPTGSFFDRFGPRAW